MTKDILGINPIAGVDSIKNENVVVITNSAIELNVFAEHGLACIYTSNPLNTVKEIENLQLQEESKNYNIKEIYLCFTEEDESTCSYYRKFKEESFIAEKLNKLGIDTKSIQIDAYKKDLQIPSVFSRTNKELLADYLNKVKESYKTKLNDVEKSFIKNRRTFFRQEQYKKLDSKKISTGFKELDKAFEGGLEEGLYLLTGGSSVGKTAFVTNLADNIAEQKQNVLYFSLEMKEANLISRGIARQMFKKNSKTPVSYKDIETGRVFSYSLIDEDEYSAAEDFYFNEIGEYLTIEEGNLLSTSHLDIYNKAKMIRDMTAQSPVIIVDYLQQMTSATNPDALKATIIEQNIAGLKQISKDFETAVIVISSLSRADALEPISMQSFAHTSAIEYTADVCMGLALEMVYTEKFIATKNLADKRMLIKEAISESTRLIRLSLVKNRLGVASKDILMNYTPRNNAYLECPEYMQNFTEVKDVDIPKEFTSTSTGTEKELEIKKDKPTEFTLK